MRAQRLILALSLREARLHALPAAALAEREHDSVISEIAWRIRPPARDFHSAHRAREHAAVLNYGAVITTITDVIERVFGVRGLTQKSD